MSDHFKKWKQKIINQINDSPEPLRSYIHSLEAGIDASILLHNEQLRSEIGDLKEVLDKRTVELKYYDRQGKVLLKG